MNNLDGIYSPVYASNSQPEMAWTGSNFQGQNPTYAYGNSQFNNQISKRCYEEMVVNHQKMLEYRENACLNAENQRIMESLKQKNRLELENVKRENAEKRDAAIQERKEQRSLARKALFKDMDGYLCMQTIFPNGKKYYSNRVLSVADIEMTCIIDITNFDRRVGLLEWNREKKKHLLKEQDFSAKGLEKLFEKNGVALEVGRDRKREMLGMIWQFLMENSKHISAFPYRGWCYTRDGWKFADHQNMTIEYIMQED